MNIEWKHTRVFHISIPAELEKAALQCCCNIVTYLAIYRLYQLSDIALYPTGTHTVMMTLLVRLTIVWLMHINGCIRKFSGGIDVTVRTTCNPDWWKIKRDPETRIPKNVTNLKLCQNTNYRFFYEHLFKNIKRAIYKHQSSYDQCFMFIYNYVSHFFVFIGKNVHNAQNAINKTT